MADLYVSSLNSIRMNTGARLFGGFDDLRTTNYAIANYKTVYAHKLTNLNKMQ